MGRGLTYVGVFVVAVVLLQLFVFDSMRLGVWFNPLAYIAFVILLPANAKPLAVLMLGFMTGLFVDLFEGTAGLCTAVTLFTAWTRRPVMILTLGREVVEEAGAMPSPKLLGGGKFFRYAAFTVGVHCLLYFSLEALTLANYGLVLIKTFVSGVVTLGAVWMTSLLFTIKSRRKV